MEVADANLAYQEMLRDVAQRTQTVESEEDFEPLSEDQDLQCPPQAGRVD